MKLPGKRLELCASFVRDGAMLADIGSDHGYLPVFLKLAGRVKNAIAADIGESPLNSARLNVARYNADIECILSDGFENIPSDKVTDAVIAGMGGELISNIIGKTDYLKNPDVRLILQPMTFESELREFLREENFEIEQEKTCVDSGKVYTVICCSYNASPVKTEDILYSRMGKIEPHSEAADVYAEKVIKKLRNQLFGAEHKGETAEAEKLENIISKIEEIYLR